MKCFGDHYKLQKNPKSSPIYRENTMNSHQQTLMYLGHLKRIQIAFKCRKETTAGRIDQVGMKLLT